MNLPELILAWSRLLRTNPKEILVLLRRCPYQYKHYQIPKRTGGLRDIYHPTPNLKAVQRWLVSNCFVNLPVHPSVHSYRKGIGIRKHASYHSHSNFLLRLDFSDFFPSVDSRWLEEFLLSHAQKGTLGIEPEAIPTVIRLVCRFNKNDDSLALTIGAPSSPILTNAILFEVDSIATERCAELSCRYTRYADDIYLSSCEKNKLCDAEKEIRRIFSEIAPQLRFNEQKTINTSKKGRRVVTGVTLTTDRKLSVGREMKRSVKTQVFLSLRGELPVGEKSRLCGLIAYIRDIEPDFYDSLCRKFGAESIDNLHRNSA